MNKLGIGCKIFTSGRPKELEGMVDRWLEAYKGELSDIKVCYGESSPDEPDRIITTRTIVIFYNVWEDE